MFADLFDGRESPISRHKHISLRSRKRVQKGPDQIPQVDGFFDLFRALISQAVRKLLKSQRDLTAAALDAVFAAQDTQRQAACDLAEENRQRIGAVRWYCVPRAEPGVVDAFFRILPVVDDAVSNAVAVVPVF